jgi:iron-sulfur cluster assembly protein
MIQVTEKAQEQFGEFFKEKADVLHSIRVYLQEGGWGGPSLRLALDEPKGSDESFDSGEIKFVIDNDLKARTGDVIIDFVEMGGQSGFSVTPAKAVGGSCGVGGSCSCWRDGGQSNLNCIETPRYRLGRFFLGSADEHRSWDILERLGLPAQPAVGAAGVGWLCVVMVEPLGEQVHSYVGPGAAARRAHHHCDQARPFSLSSRGYIEAGLSNITRFQAIQAIIGPEEFVCAMYRILAIADRGHALRAPAEDFRIL